MKDNENSYKKGEVKEVNSLFYEDIQKALALHVWQHDYLREEILENPKSVIEKELNIKFDDKVKINVINQGDPNQIYFTLPYNLSEAFSKAFNEEQLDEIAAKISFKYAMKFAKDAIQLYGEDTGDVIGNGFGRGFLLETLETPLPKTGTNRTIRKTLDDIA